MSDTGTVIGAREGSLAILTLSYPERRNALSLALREVLFDEMQHAMADESVRVIIVTGEGGNFCSGGDISSFEGVTPASGRVRMQRIHRVVRLMINGPKPVIAAVEGHAVGAGLCVAAACDIVVAARNARLSCTFNRIGLLPDFGGMWTLPLRMGVGRAKMMMMSGRTIDGEAGERVGLVDLVSEPGAALEDAKALARDIAKGAPLSNEFVKAAMARGPASLEAMLAIEADAQGVLYGTEDLQEGRQAFLAKRPPEFKGK
ncbi:MAG: enoyl-CoA hydratase/isomerase family protein [Caulobacterales bacterium]